MSRLPTPGGDNNTWGDILNDFLLVEHFADGTLRQSAAIAAKAVDSSIVHLAGSETVSGSKTFSSSPFVPAPVQPLHAATKAYTDAAMPLTSKVAFYDIPNNYGTTSWVFQPVMSNGAAVGGVPYYGGYNQSGAGTTVEELSYDVILAAGTWSFYAYHLLGPNTGQFSILVDGTESTSIDTYTGSYTSTITPAITGLILTTGRHTITIRKKGTKNAASSDYYILWSGVMAIQTSG